MPVRAQSTTPNSSDQKHTLHPLPLPPGPLQHQWSKTLMTTSFLPLPKTTTHAASKWPKNSIDAGISSNTFSTNYHPPLISGQMNIISTLLTSQMLKFRASSSGNSGTLSSKPSPRQAFATHGSKHATTSVPPAIQPPLVRPMLMARRLWLR